MAAAPPFRWQRGREQQGFQAREMIFGQLLAVTEALKELSYDLVDGELRKEFCGPYTPEYWPLTQELGDI